MRRIALTLVAATALAAPAASAAAAPERPALPKTERTLTDPVDRGAAYDVTSVVLRAAPRSGRPAVVVVKHARPVEVGDAIDAWFDLNADKVPDLHLAGQSFSEYTVHATSSWTRDGRDVSDRDCVRLSMSGHVSKVRLFPDCVGQPVAFAVAVRSSSDGATAAAADWVPGERRFSPRVLAQPLS